jgi:uncharacterized protein YndB with AHSA1/START domain
MDGTLKREGDRYVLYYERLLAHPVERVWRAVTEPSELAAWFPGQVEISLEPGGAVRFAQPGFDVDLALLPTSGTVTALDPPSELAFTWGDDELRFVLTPSGDSCLLVFTHAFTNRASARRSGAGWSMCLDALVAMCAGVARPPNRWPEYFARYTDELGADGTCSRDGDGDGVVLRVERVVDVPATELWRALTEPERLVTWLGATELELVEGGRIEIEPIGPPGGRPVRVTGRIVRATAPIVFEHTWVEADGSKGTLLWQLIAAGERCIVLLTHRAPRGADAAGLLAAWDVRLARLATSLAGYPPGPFAGLRWRELRQRYAAVVADR